MEQGLLRGMTSSVEPAPSQPPDETLRRAVGQLGLAAGRVQLSRRQPWAQPLNLLSEAIREQTNDVDETFGRRVAVLR